MIRRSILLISFVVVLATIGCIKTYDMKMLSGEVSLSPSLALSAIKGNISLIDILKPSDTVRIDQNKFVKLIFKKDSVINLKMTDFYDLNNMVSVTESYTIGSLSISDFQSNSDYTLNQMMQFFPTALRDLLNNGLPKPFPPIPPTNLVERAFSPFSNFENAVFKSGFIDISIKNNLPAPLNSITVSLYNTIGHTAIGNAVTIPASLPGQTSKASIDITNQTVTKSVSAAISLSGSPGNNTTSLINLNTSNIQITIKGRDLKVKSGKVILPVQNLASFNTNDTVTFNPGTGIEIDMFKITKGNLSYKIQSTTSLSASLTISLPTALRGGIPISEVINIGPVSNFNGNISFNNTVAYLGIDPKQPFNRVPVVYGIVVNSGSNLVSFNENDMVKLELKLLNPDFEYVKGYFGQQVETIQPDSFDLGIEDFLSHVTGDFLVASPSIRLNYSNSFSIPMQINFNATGKRKAKSVNLDWKQNPYNITYPVAPAKRDVSDFLTIDKTNSSLPALISMPPEEIRFSGDAKMNPGPSNGKRDNYVFGNSRLLGSLEIEVPMDFWFNLQFADTVDNFLKDDVNSKENPIKPEKFDSLHVVLAAKNGFPLGVSIMMSLYNSATHHNIANVDASGLLEAAPVDTNGKAVGFTETSTSIRITKEFFSSVTEADKIIFVFKLKSKDNSVVKIYSDYRIDFNASLIVKPNISFN